MSGFLWLTLFFSSTPIFLVSLLLFLSLFLREKRSKNNTQIFFSSTASSSSLSLSLHLCCASHYSLFSQEKVKCCKKKETIQSKVHTMAPPLPLKLIASFLQFYFYSFSLANKFILCTTVKKAAATSVGRGYKGK